MTKTPGTRRPLVAERRTKRTSTEQPKRRKKAAARPRKPRGPIRGILFSVLYWITNLIWKVTSRTALVLGTALAVGVFYYYSTLPPASDLVDGRARGSVTMLDRGGEVFAWRGDQFGGMITSDTVSPYLKNAVLATEDKRFYRHFGLSPRGIASAVRINLREGRGPLSGHGGSTITQQTAKLLCLGVPFDQERWKNESAYEADCRRTTVWRKIKEATYALALEAKYSKADILTIYMNRVFLGSGARGFEAASERYFGKSAAEVDPAEAAMLAGLLVAPTRYAPTNNLKRSRDRAEVILGLMEDQGYLTGAQKMAALRNPATLSKAAAAKAGGYFADWVMDSGPTFLTRDTTEDVIIRTTFDPHIQRAIEGALADIFATKVRQGSKAQAAIVVMSADGAVRAMVGGRKIEVIGAFNRATHALRQTGSAFKPFVYAAALDLGYTPRATVMDAPLTIKVPGSGSWSPRNYTKKYKGEVTLTQAFMHSLNTPAVRISEDVGRANVRKIAQDFGILNELAQGPALALGASESTLIEMTGAYAGILNGGRSVTPYGLTELRLMGDDMALMGQDGGMGERVISERAAGHLTYMMSRVIEAGTGKRAKLSDRPSAGKTGTTQAARDAWFIGFTGDYVAGVWMGYDNNTPLKDVTGGGLPAEIWQEAMTRIHQGLTPRPLPILAPNAKPAKPAVAVAERTPAPQAEPNIAEQVLLDVLGNMSKN